MNAKVNMGEQTEDQAQASVESAFSPLFVFRAPRRKGGKEATDVLVPWDDIGLIIEAKSRAREAAGNAQADSPERVRKKLVKAWRQLEGAARAIHEGRLSHMENGLRGRIPFPKEEIKWLYGVIVLDHESAPYDPFEVAPELQGTTLPLHVFSLRDFQDLAAILDTPVDLINYLETRSDVLLSTLKPRVHEEEIVFRFFVDNLESLTAFRARKRGASLTEGDARSYAEQLRRLFAGVLPETRAGLVIDHMIARAHEQDHSLGPLQVGQEVIEINASEPVKVATELSAIPRVRRIALGKRYLRTIQRAAADQKDAWKSTHSTARGDCMLFLASPLPNDQRHERQKRLLAMTEMLKHYHQVGKAIGVATEAGADSGRSYDFVYLEGEPITNEAAFQAAKDLFGEPVGLLTDEPR